ncbi:MAG: hypothetical protein KY452_08790, partial [Actinobacteria bacterium]|nr:hypothetical protein [Actinomycetota bacterium]
DVRHRRPVEGGVRLELAPGAPVGTIAQLAAAEQSCCRFFAFALTVDERGPALEVTAPSGAADVVASLFGAPPADPPGDTDAATDHEEPAPD